MLNRKIQRIRTLEARLEQAIAQRDDAREELDSAVRLNSRLAQQVDAQPAPVDWEAVATQIAHDRTEAHRADRWHIGRLEADIDGLTEMCAIGTRWLQRLARAVWHLRKANAEKDAELACQAAQLSKLRDKIEEYEGGDRAVKLAPVIEGPARCGRLPRRRNRHRGGPAREVDPAPVRPVARRPAECPPGVPPLRPL
jgi:hypothetical protein